MIERWADGQETAGLPDAPAHATALHGVAPVSAPALEPAPADGAVTQTRRGWGGRVAWLVALVTVGVLLGLAIITLLKFVDGPVSSGPGNIRGVQMTASPSATPALSMWAGKYAELKYPGVFDQIGHAGGSARTLEAYNLSSRSGYERQISINISQLPSGLLDDDSSYAFRRNQASVYTKEVTKLMGEPVVKMSKADKTEVVVFWVHQDKLLTVAATTSNPSKHNLASYVADIEPTIRWRQ